MSVIVYERSSYSVWGYYTELAEAVAKARECVDSISEFNMVSEVELVDMPVTRLVIALVEACSSAHSIPDALRKREKLVCVVHRWGEEWPGYVPLDDC